VVSDVYPNLDTASVCPLADTYPVRFGAYLIPSAFIAVFNFRDKKRIWNSILTISVSDLGVPVLTDVHVKGSLSTKLQGSVGVTRTQLKFIEENRFDLFESALVMAVTRIIQTKNIDGSYDLVSFDGSDTYKRNFDKIELIKLRKEIDTRMRRRINSNYLKYIADIYTKAVIDGQNPIQTIMDTERVKHRTASEYATKARRQRLLPKTDPGIVTINRPTTKKGKK